MASGLTFLCWRPLVPCIFLALAACGGGQGSVPETPQPASRILDPVAAFAADSGGQAERQILLPDTGESAKLRMLRQYTAASGRECREVRVTARNLDNTRLFCQAGTGWIEARPLLAAGKTQP